MKTMCITLGLMAASAVIPSSVFAGDATKPSAPQHLIENPDAGWDIGVSINHPDGVYTVGDKLSLSVTAPRTCYLHIINVSPEGDINVLWPVDQRTSNLVEPDQEVVFPDPNSNPRLVFEAKQPVGKEMIVCFATTTPLNLKQPKDAKMFLEFLDGVGQVSPVPLARLKSFITRVERQPEGWTARAVEITTQETLDTPAAEPQNVQVGG